MDALLAAGANPNLQGGEDCTAVKAACRRGDVEIVEKLLKSGADPRIYRGSTSSALQEACASGSLPIVKLLIESGVDVNSFGKKPLTLHVLSSIDRKNLVE